MATAEVNSSSAGMKMMAGKNKSRKPYVMTRPRERWTAEEHDCFVHALHLFGRDWKSIQAFVATKTATQIRSHAQKHFLKAQKEKLAGLAAAAPRSHPPRSRSSAVCTAASWCAVDGGGASSAAAPDVETTVQLLPLSPADLRFAQVYRFLGDVFGSAAPWPVEAQLHRLLGADPVVVDTILRVLANLEENFSV